MKNYFYRISVLLSLISLVLPVLAFAEMEMTKMTSFGLNPLEKMKPNGEYVVEVFNDNKWQEAGSLSFDKDFREREIDLNKFITDNETLKIRLNEKGGGAAHIDSILLGGIPPQELKGSEDNLALKKLSKKDFDVIDAYKKTIELSFPSKGEKKLSLTARVEAEVISKFPFQFPIKNSLAKIDENSAFYPYVINSNHGNIKVDGNIEDEGFSEPFFKEFPRTGSGHPSDYTYGWVRNDEKNLYVALDFVPDNTMDGDKDYAKVYVKTLSGVREFKASVPEQTWGKSGFAYTQRADYQHKVYEFSIPFGELGIENIADGEKMELAFAAYGTAAVAVDFGDAPDTYGTLLASNGARHAITGGLYLGVSVDGEIDGQPDATATGDDSDGNDDEDGVVFSFSPVQGMSSAAVQVTASANGLLNAWVDFNADGDWADAGEQIFTDQSLVAGVNNLIFTVPASAVIGDTFARFRVDSSGGLIPTGSAADGEVEDYMITIFSSECFPPPSGMISWWGGDDNALDMIGTNNGTLMNGVTYAIGQVGQSFLFDGADDFVDLGTDGVFNFSSGTGDFTIDMWIYPDILPDFAYGLASKATHGPGGQFTGPYSGWSFYMYADGSLGFGGAGVWEFTSSSGTVTAGIGQHIAITKSGTTYKLYHNGTEVASVDHGNLETSASELLLGASYADDNFFNGSIDEVEIFNRALTVDEIALIYYAGSAGKCRSCVESPSDMVSWWKGEDNTEDTTGTNDGTQMNGASYADGKVGRAFSFDGVNDYVQVPHSPALDITGAITMDAWININAADDGVILIKGDPGCFVGSCSYGMALDPDGSVFMIMYSSGTEWCWSDPGIISPNQWYHIAASWDGTTGTPNNVTLYVNGTMAKSCTKTTVLNSNSEPLIIGSHGSSLGRQFSGLIDEVEIFNRALSVDEIAAIYNAGSAGKCDSDTTPDAFTFTDQTDVNLSTVIESNTITVSGINSATFIGITDCTGTNCEYRINSGGWTSSNGTVNNGDTVQVRQTSSGSYSTTTDLTLNIGPAFDIFSVTTMESPETDPLPDLTGNWEGPLTEKCKEKKDGLVCKVKGKLIIRNIGETDAQYVKVSFYLSDDDSYDESDILLNEVVRKNVVLGKEYKKSFKAVLPVGVTLEGRYIIAYIDADNTTTESDENNNFVVYGEEE